MALSTIYFIGIYADIFPIPTSYMKCFFENEQWTLFLIANSCGISRKPGLILSMHVGKNVYDWLVNKPMKMFFASTTLNSML